jgi:hypothetical protein
MKDSPNNSAHRRWKQTKQEDGQYQATGEEKDSRSSIHSAAQNQTLKQQKNN